MGTTKDKPYSNLAEAQEIIDKGLKKDFPEPRVAVSLNYSTDLYLSNKDAATLLEILGRGVLVRKGYNEPSKVGRLEDSSELFAYRITSVDEVELHQVSELLGIPYRDIKISKGVLEELPVDELNY